MSRELGQVGQVGMEAEQTGAVWAKTGTRPGPQAQSSLTAHPQSGPDPAESASPDLVLGMFDI